MSGLRLRSLRLAWLWCLAYTVPVGPDLRARRRDEMLSHLWESETAGVRAHRLLSAAVRGAGADVAWTVRRGWRYTLGLPEAWVAVAAFFPLLAWVMSMLSPSRGNGVDAIGGLGGPAFLGVSGVTWLVRRRRG